MPSLPRSQASANGKLLAALIRSRVQLQKIEARVFRRDYLPILRKMDGEIQAAVARAQAVGVNEISQAKLQSLLADVEAIIRNGTASLKPATAAGVAQAVGREVRQQVGIAKRAVPAALSKAFQGVPVSTVATITNSTVDGLMGPFVDSYGTAQLQRAKAAILHAVAFGEDMKQAARRVQQAMDVGKTQALAIARTGIQKAAADTADAFHRENSDIFRGVMYTATLDTRTCPVCGPDDGKVYAHEPKSGERPFDGKPEIPRHPNCRCTYVPVTKTWRDLGVDVDDTAASSAERASMDGQVPASTDYDSWLKGQPANIQRSILGPERYALWKSGKISLADFSVDNHRRTVGELLALVGDA